ncbi:carbohydrate binding domain-containing protein [Micromonospora sp. WMMA1363]|uniref:carbohydrate binding domain-containing protein n=1 Tax=Micromonospora sp. WMMA1363 TaxID=3053985 RepID=UPI00259CBDCB|nr:carbohydrate binding domain-containing protein [Micromonospora sp. WMMA1363]MDM4720855.1 carbohydrate binding domain-containing protein [Micromonospora sp. WMMA1363]
MHPDPDRRRGGFRTAALLILALAASLLVTPGVVQALPGQVTANSAGVEPPAAGVLQTVEDYEDGVPPEVMLFASTDAERPVVSTVATGDRPGAGGDDDTFAVRYDIDGWGGFTHNFVAPDGHQDWRAYDGFSFWVKGEGTGRRVQFEIKDGGAHGEASELWESFFVDDSTGWKQIRTTFPEFVWRTSYQPGDGPKDRELQLDRMWGFAVNLPQGAGELHFDQVELFTNVATVADFEAPQPPLHPPAGQPGIITFSGDASRVPELSYVDAPRDDVPAGNRALAVAVDTTTSWAGFAHNLSFDTEPQDWSRFGGFRFWYFSPLTVPPAAPGAGHRINLEIKDGGADAEHSELWTTSFTEDWVGWRLVEIPFSQFRYRTDYQPVGGINQELDLDRMWGYAMQPSAGYADTLRIDDVQVYGVPEVRPTVRVDATPAVTLLDEGGSATVTIRLTNTDDLPLDDDVTLRYATGSGSATVGEDYEPVEGEFVFPAGTASGATRQITVRTLTDDQAETAENIPLTLSGNGLAVTEDLPNIVVNAHDLPYLDPSRPVDERVADLLGRMSVEEKVGQMTQAERNALDAPDDPATWRLGSLLSGGGSTPDPNTPESWADMVDGYQTRTLQTRLQIPLVYGVDAVHGHSNLRGATIFPHNIGLGAARDPDLVERAGHITAKETRATGPQWSFAPCACVARDDRWGRTYEAYGEDPALVVANETVIDGLQGRSLADRKDADRVLASVKHYAGDGGTAYQPGNGGYPIDQGVAIMSREEFDRIHLGPYVPAVRKHHAGTIMPSYSSVDFTDDGVGNPVKMHAHKELLTDVLKQDIGFDGFLISDYAAIDQIPGDYASDVRTAINAGLDMIMVPNEYQRFEETLRGQIEAGNVPMSRIDDAVSRILTQKFHLGLFEQPFTDRAHLADVGSPAHRAVAREAAAKSQVLLRNTGQVLPLATTGKLYVAGGNADDVGAQSGGWTITWQGNNGDITPGTTILEGMRQVAPDAEITYSADASAPLAGHDRAVVVVGERPYAEGQGDVGNNGFTMTLSAAERGTVDRVCSAVADCVVLVVSGRPLVLDETLAQADAVVASWLPGTEGAGVADVLFGERPFTGRLPVSWPRSLDQEPINVGDAGYDPLYAYGWGLRTDATRDRLRQLRAELAEIKHDGWIRAAVTLLDRSLRDGSSWHADGSVRDERRVVKDLTVVSALLAPTNRDDAAQHELLVSALRDVAQAAIGREGVAAASTTRTATLTADAEHALLIGKPTTAALKLAAAWRVAAG